MRHPCPFYRLDKMRLNIREFLLENQVCVYSVGFAKPERNL